MITLNESTNWIAQHSMLIEIIAFVTLTLAASLVISAIFMHYTYNGASGSSFERGTKVTLCIAGVISLVSISLGVLTMSLGEARYSGSADYTIEQVKTQSSGQKTIMVNDGKSDVDLNVDNKDKTSYTKGDKVNVEVQSFNTKQSGKHYLGSIIKESANESVLSETDYTIKKID